MSRPYPILFFAYNRPKHTRASLSSLQKNPLAAQSTLYVFSDAAKTEEHETNVREVRRYLKDIAGFKEVHLIEQKKNLGLAESVKSGVSKVLEAEEAVIVLEDDLIVTPEFLEFMNLALRTYQCNQKIFSVSGWAPDIELPNGFPLPVYLSRRAFCWGWATWRDRWADIDWQVKDHESFKRDKKSRSAFNAGGDDMCDMLDNAVTGRISSWAIRWCYSQFRHGQYAVVPRFSYVSNIGQDGSGENSKARYELSHAPFANASIGPLPEEILADDKIQENLRKFYAYNWLAKIKKALGLL